MPASAQIVRSRSVAPIAFITRALIRSRWRKPIVPRYEYGRIASPPNSSRTAARRGAHQPDRLVPRRLPELAGALGTVAHERTGQPVGRVDALDVVVDLGAQRPGRDRVVGIAGDLHRPPVLDRHEHRARVGAVVRARGVNDPPTHTAYVTTGGRACRASRSATSRAGNRRRRRRPERTRRCRPVVGWTRSSVTTPSSSP